MKTHPVAARCLALLLVMSGCTDFVRAQENGAQLQACDSENAQSVLVASHPSTAALPAQAYWLARDLLLWPAHASLARYRLYYAAQAQIQLTPGEPVRGADGVLALQAASEGPAQSSDARFKFVAAGALLQVAPAERPRLGELLRQQLVLVQEDADHRLVEATRLQNPGALDDLYGGAAELTNLGAVIDAGTTSFTLWAPTATQVSMCLYPQTHAAATAVQTLQFDARTGAWQLRLPRSLAGNYYSYLVDVLVPGVGLVRNRVTDPYSQSLNADSQRSYVADMQASALMPRGWAQHRAPTRVQQPTDMVVYELHVRDFSINDASVRAPWRGKYLAFTEPQSRGMQHLRSLAQAGLTDVHLLPVFDIASVPERGCTNPIVPTAAPDSLAQQAAVMAQADGDCFNWGYDPYHYNAPEGSYATDADDAAVRIREFRAMVMALHQAGLRVGMDVVYNHTAAAAQAAKSVLDRIVPGYYQRLNAQGQIEHSTCCDNTATEHLMMGKLMVDSVTAWVRDYRIDSFRFDLMGHQPRAVMEQLQQRAAVVAGHPVQLLGEGWNFGEIANGARFVQASQLALGGSGIGTFSDRGRDAVRGGHAGERGNELVANQGYVNGLVYDPNELAQAPPEALLRTADMVRLGLAGSQQDYVMTDYTGRARALRDYDYGGQPGGYASAPSEVVNYVENHDNQTLFDINVYKLPLGTSRSERARVQMLAAAITMFSQGVAYFHAGVETLRSKSMDGNSFNSGDWFNRLDWRFRDNYFGTGAPPAPDNAANYPWILPRLARADIRPRPADIRWARDQFADLLRLRASSTLFRLSSSQAIQERLRFYNTGPQQVPTVLVGHLHGSGYPGAGFAELVYVVNVDKRPHSLVVAPLQGMPLALHPVQRSPQAADARVRTGAKFDPAQARFQIPARSAAVFVLP